MTRKRPKSLVLFGNGINCEYETAHANRAAGFAVDRLHIDRLMENPKDIHRYTFINFPGGFLDGDDLGSAKAQAVKWCHQKLHGSRERFIDELIRFVSEGKILLGICNGFQLLVKTGLLPATAGEYGRQTVTLTSNDSGRFEDRWVYLKTNQFSHCIFTRDMDKIYLPVRHGEGKCIVDSEETAVPIRKGGHIVLQYADEKGDVTNEYPYSPNGSTEAIAGLCDASGRIFGLMPHPEGFIRYTQHPRWTRESLDEEGDGLKIFKNAYRFVSENQ
jgi:phosphoribosylformylglycinamidine synthase